MSLSVAAVMGASNVIISLSRNLIPNRIRIIVQLVVVASMVILVDQILRAFAYDVSKQLSIFIGLIITSIVSLWGALAAFALGNGVWKSFPGRNWKSLPGMRIYPHRGGFLQRTLWFRETLLDFQVISRCSFTKWDMVGPRIDVIVAHGCNYCRRDTLVGSNAPAQRKLIEKNWIMEGYLNLICKEYFY